MREKRENYRARSLRVIHNRLRLEIIISVRSSFVPPYLSVSREKPSVNFIVSSRENKNDQRIVSFLRRSTPKKILGFRDSREINKDVKFLLADLVFVQLSHFYVIYVSV